MDELTDARSLGRLEAESLDRALREREGREREDRLARLAMGAEPAWETGGGLAEESSGTMWRLQQEIERLTAFHRAVVGSKAWRLIQALRRLAGRAW
jgi:hypothetical protein